MYQQEQNRTDSNQGMHFHVHQCVCTSPLYNPYRQPMIAPYVPPPPVARPYNLAHYQYTSYNIPYNVPVFNPNAIAQVPTAAPIPENIRLEQTEPIPLRNPEELEDFQPNDASTEDFTKFLEQGCIIAEKIAIRNQHRPCFKNIQNLCNRTKNEILKPSHTVSNIHSQGIPWATKDFIYAYVRLINCWHMLKGYLQAKDGTLGNIDRELTAEFKNCYAVWEGNTKDLAEHMIRIFSNLDNNVSNPSNNQPYINRVRMTRTTPTTLLVDPVTNPEVSVPPPPPPPPTEEAIQLSESTTEPSPREDESDGEGRVYMKPGSYNVPKKNSSSDNSTPSIEFLETAMNIVPQFRIPEVIQQPEPPKKQSEASDKEWRNAISATPVLIKRNGGNLDSRFEELDNPNVDVEQIRRWLYHDHFDQQNLAYPISEMKMPERQVTLLQHVDQKGKLDRENEAMKILLDELEKTQLNQTLMAKTKESDILKQILEFRSILDDALKRLFPDLEFSDHKTEIQELEVKITGGNKA